MRPAGTLASVADRKRWHDVSHDLRIAVCACGNR
jgi:hypothetical protein